MPYSRLIDQFEAQAALCSDDRDLAGVLQDAVRELGFDYFALLHHASLCSSRPELIRIDTYPSGWERELEARGLIGADPVHHASVRTNIGFAWSELPSLVPIGRRAREVLERSRRFDISDGFTVPVNVPGEPCGSCSFAVRIGAGLPLERLLCAEQIGAHAFRAARRLHGYPASARCPHLSRRERQCVRLLAAGKTDWEIAAILGISVETAHQYVKRARAAYDVVSRAQLVACVLRDALVSFDDAIPPAR
ncbi:LuxR family transcriptional regulator [Sphingosinicella rhizophila]|uniref:LuxR family transcriptional regulator n=1 Tax=Sphingosinicella rhizophila TaxID=3050082 RepID=A0ABU3Q9S5_9SPHN|nr:LuxR family transcriptional regulator [Sphingosinicella sp. GR2756]MDT9599869.1 LuxR family transcriptional regulator [Sphingosinicella sp. GR2756]